MNKSIILILALQCTFMYSVVPTRLGIISSRGAAVRYEQLMRQAFQQGNIGALKAMTGQVPSSQEITDIYNTHWLLRNQTVNGNLPSQVADAQLNVCAKAVGLAGIVGYMAHLIPMSMKIKMGIGSAGLLGAWWFGKHGFDKIQKNQEECDDITAELQYKKSLWNSLGDVTKCSLDQYERWKTLSTDDTKWVKDLQAKGLLKETMFVQPPHDKAPVESHMDWKRYFEAKLNALEPHTQFSSTRGTVESLQYLRF